jgi:DNA-binding PadR family transcriptional regulator
MPPARRVTSNPLALAVLAYLAERPMHPYELGKLFTARKQHESIRYRHSSLYMVVEQLQRAALVVPVETQRDSRRPERTIYALTEAGRAELQDWMRELVATPVKEYRQFEAALSLIVVLPPATVRELLGERLDALTAEADRIRAHIEASEVDPVFLVEHEYRLALLDAERGFVSGLVSRVETAEQTGFGRFWREFHAKPQNV